MDDQEEVIREEQDHNTSTNDAREDDSLKSKILAGRW
jgi:hypothetical protein